MLKIEEVTVKKFHGELIELIAEWIVNGVTIRLYSDDDNGLLLTALDSGLVVSPIDNEELPLAIIEVPNSEETVTVITGGGSVSVDHIGNTIDLRPDDRFFMPSFIDFTEEE